MGVFTRALCAFVTGISIITCAFGSRVDVFANSFREGGWSLDVQFMDKMGSPYLLAHGFGSPVPDATATATVPEAGLWRVWVRSRKWVDGAGFFKVLVDGRPLGKTFGAASDKWGWEEGGEVELKAGAVKITLRDLDGFDGRCAGIVLVKGDDAPKGAINVLGRPPEQDYDCDFVVVGGGLAGCCAAVAAARAGISVALVQDRPVPGGNASGEIRVWSAGEIRYPLVNELRGKFMNKDAGNALSDQDRIAILEREPNLSCFYWHRAFGVEKRDEGIAAVKALDVKGNRVVRFRAPLFCDATGDGWVGYWAGADWRSGREAKSETGESLAPEKGDEMTLGSSIMWDSAEGTYDIPFSAPWAEPYACGLSMTTGRWNWEFGLTQNIFEEGEAVRDRILLAIYGAFSNAKKDPRNAHRRLVTCPFVLGKRESRRLMGDYIFCEQDVREKRQFEDAVATGSWSIDLHYTKDEKIPFVTKCEQTYLGRYWIPYRSLYSRNVTNLFMAGRCFSCTHVGLGSPRVMNTLAQMGCVVGEAAAMCRKGGYSPRGLYSGGLVRELQRRLGGAFPGVPDPKEKGWLIVDDEDKSVSFEGDWYYSWNCNGGAVGLRSHFALKRNAKAVYPLPVKQKGRYLLKGRVPHLFTTSAVTPARLTVRSGGKTAEIVWNQLPESGTWCDLGTVDLEPGATLEMTPAVEGPAPDGKEEIDSFVADGFALVNLVAAGIHSCCEVLSGQRIELSDGWEFRREGGAWERVCVPHDWAIAGPFDGSLDRQVVAIAEDGEKEATLKTGQTGGLPWIGKGEYRVTVNIPEGTGFASLVFDGAMSEPEVFCDGAKIGEWKNGYNAFEVELPQTAGEHQILVKLTNRPLSSRWYPGAGLIRPVKLVLGGETGVRTWGNVVWCPDLGTVRVKTECRGRPGRIVHRIVDGGREVSVSETGELKGAFESWSPENPKLYTLVTEVYGRDGKLAERMTERIGVRTLEYGKDGFKLNGEKRKFRGVCLHHDLGPLGAAFDKDAFRRQMTLLKEMGCDSLRTSHNMPGEGQLEVCDELGVLVMAESFDSWANTKVANGYNLFFKDWWRKDLENLVKKCRNHPSVVMWSIGNEISEQKDPAGVAIIREMQALCHLFDPDPARKVTQGLSWMPEAIKSGWNAAMEIPAVTYRLPFYEAMLTNSAAGFVLGAETASTVSSRGEYFFPVEIGSGKLHANNQCSGYDVECAPWSNLPDDDWVMQEDRPWTIGEFVWTGFDYLGEPHPYSGRWPSRSAYFGIFDLAGLPKDRYWLYRSHWNTASHTLHLVPHWTFSGREGQVTPVYCYTDFDEAELFVNGKSQGRRRKDPKSRLDRYRLRWNEVRYEPGELKVIAYGKDGKPALTESVRTAGKPVRTELEKRRFGELLFVTATVVDEKGVPVPDADGELSFTCGKGLEFVAICNGDATSTESFVEPHMKAFHGKLVAVFRGPGDDVKCEGGFSELE